MDIVYILIGFACGFLCRQVIWLEQKRQAKIRYHQELQDVRDHIMEMKRSVKKHKKEKSNELR